MPDAVRSASAQSHKRCPEGSIEKTCRISPHPNSGGRTDVDGKGFRAYHCEFVLTVVAGGCIWEDSNKEKLDRK